MGCHCLGASEGHPFCHCLGDSKPQTTQLQTLGQGCVQFSINPGLWAAVKALFCGWHKATKRFYNPHLATALAFLWPSTGCLEHSMSFLPGLFPREAEWRVWRPSGLGTSVSVCLAVTKPFFLRVVRDIRRQKEITKQFKSSTIKSIKKFEQPSSQEDVDPIKRTLSSSFGRDSGSRGEGRML